ncbi:MAG: OsmC family protein [Chloroflexota bacterium]
MTIKSVELTYGVDLHFDASTGTGRSLAFDDDAAAGLGPVEAVLAALAACTAMDVAAILDKKRQVVETYSVSVDAVQREEYPQVLTRIRLLHDVAGPDVTEAALRRSIELSATKYCPVNAMLSAGPTEIHHGYRVIGTGPRPFDEEGEVLVTGPYRRADPVD